MYFPELTEGLCITLRYNTWKFQEETAFSTTINCLEHLEHETQRNQEYRDVDVFDVPHTKDTYLSLHCLGEAILKPTERAPVTLKSRAQKIN